jgi:hypothetical protein
MKFEKLVGEIMESTGPAQMPLTDTEEKWLSDNGWQQIIRGRWQKVIDQIVHRVYRDSNEQLKHEISDTVEKKITTNNIGNIKDLP